MYIITSNIVIDAFNITQAIGAIHLIGQIQGGCSARREGREIPEHCMISWRLQYTQSVTANKAKTSLQSLTYNILYFFF